ncbi:phospholipase D family protein [Allorhizobium sp. BGMRC 0089]|uniref:phospholipase D family protein n=1 Tax=Allorhizobium sonneratiae TaxID=2934936 RepID=UPI002033F363|nr:phospholipase D family protein [Allorhizobium sonneratiae]MCM2291436.1 phospholipase D family protein [Allorhizobium sonneratiae]
MDFMNQPFTGQLGNRLIELLDSQDYHTLNIAVAFAKNSGILRIKDCLQRFRDRGGIVNVFVGVDLGGTSYEALTALLRYADSLSVVHTEKGQTFHVKIYQFLGADKGLVVVGSHNLTGGGLWTNFESSAFIQWDKSNADKAELEKRLSDYIGELNSLGDSIMPINTQDDIDKLLENGYVAKEVSEQIRVAKAAMLGGPQERLFGNGIAAKLPAIAKPQEAGKEIDPNDSEAATVVPSFGEDRTIWFETRKLTGGSRNILDLSKKSLIESGDPAGTSFESDKENFMRGAVEFFGLDPEDTSQRKDITLNFDGIDYYENTILFPEGENANGTWRLQIKGVSAGNVKITDIFRSKGEEEKFLVGKIASFTRISENYYFLSVFSSGEIGNFRAASRIVGRNGSTRSAKLLGVI